MSAAQAPVLAVAGGYAGWRRQALRALSAGWPPDRVHWVDQSAMTRAEPMQGELLAAMPPGAADGGSEPDGAPEAEGVQIVIRVSKALAALLGEAALYRSPQRWAFLYRVLWRWQQGDRAVASAADADGARLHAMAKSVRRAKHDMIAYVRFRRREGEGVPEFLAWYAPEHDVLAYAAAHFARRMGGASWCIGTPQGAAFWDGQRLQWSAAAPAIDAMPTGESDAVEPLWLLYYQSIFNPARLNEAALRQRMPARFWRHLPEGRLIPGLMVSARNGMQRSGQAAGVGEMSGKPVAVDAQRAQPLRQGASSLEQCRRCDLWRRATQAVPGQGPASARLMLIGEQPGDVEDLAGRPFAGPAGQVLDEALHLAGVSRETLYLTNAVKHFKWVPRGKQRLHQTPAQREITACAHWLEQELQRVEPAVIIALGATALSALRQRQVRLQDHLGTPMRLGNAWLIASWHPSHALRQGGPAARASVVAEIAASLGLGRRLAEAD